MATQRKLFTLAEARALVPELRPRLEALRRCHGRLRAWGERARGAAEKARENAGFPGGAGYVALLEELHGHLRWAMERGVEVKDVGAGLVDFPAEREGRVVYLCWRCDEGTIAHWHELDTGFAGRMPLEE